MKSTKAVVEERGRVGSPDRGAWRGILSFVSARQEGLGTNQV